MTLREYSEGRREKRDITHHKVQVIWHIDLQPQVIMARITIKMEKIYKNGLRNSPVQLSHKNNSLSRNSQMKNN